MIRAVIVALSLLASAELASAQSAAAPPVPVVDTMVHVRDHDLHFVVQRGTLPLTVLMEAGGGSHAASWSEVPQRIAAATGATVVAYDRAGLGSSTLPPGELGGDQEIGDLHEGLDQLGVPEAIVLVSRRPTAHCSPS